MQENKIRSQLRFYKHIISDYFSKATGNFQHYDLSIFHEFAPPPTGGGHQFLRALWIESELRGLKIENNSISKTTRACLLNSFNFDKERLIRLFKKNTLFVHRVDGPVDIYRGNFSGVDNQIEAINQEFADKTIFQSEYSLNKHLELGLSFKKPVVIPNAVNHQIFNSFDRINFSTNRKIRIIATSWSDNINKGAPVYTWLDEHLDWKNFEFIFVGRSPVKFKNIKIVPPITSIELAKYLQQSDIYITASRNDPCSNSLTEALACGTPAIYLQSGGHPEIVKEAGLGFSEPEEVPHLLEKLISEYSVFQKKINIPTIETVTTQYLLAMELINP